MTGATLVDHSMLEAALKRPVLKRSLFSSPVKIASVELFKSDKYYFVQVRSSDGVEGVAVTNRRAEYLYPYV